MPPCLHRYSENTLIRLDWLRTAKAAWTHLPGPRAWWKSSVRIVGSTRRLGTFFRLRCYDRVGVIDGSNFRQSIRKKCGDQ